MEIDEAAQTHLERPYHPKRPHRKSRTGCRNCKIRKVKCDEARPACRSCVLRRADCIYPNSPSPPASSPESTTLVQSSREGTPPWAKDDDVFGVVSEPQYRPTNIDEVDMKLLWWYTTSSYASFAVEAGRAPAIDNILKVKIPQHAFESRFLMDTLLALSAGHLQYLKQEVDPSRAIQYRTHALEGYRKAIEEAKPETFPALLACSLMMAVTSAQMFREEGTKELYILDWMIVWRGMGLIIDLVSPEKLYESGMAELFYRPKINLEKSALSIPNHLLFMLASIKPDDVEFENVQTYYQTLKYLGSLYQEMSNGPGPILNLRVVTWFTFLPKKFLDLARERRPQALIILAHYLVFVKIVEEVWWLSRVGNREIRGIYHHLGEDWYPLLRIPRQAVHITDRLEIARLLLDDPSWVPPGPADKFNESRDPRVKSLTFVDDCGQPVVYQGTWKRDPESIDECLISEPEDKPKWNYNFDNGPGFGPRTGPE